MARTSTSDAAKAPGTTVTTPPQQTPAENTSGSAGAAGTQDVTSNAAGATPGPALPSDPANAIGSTLQAGEPSVITAAGVAAVTEDSATITLEAKPASGDQLEAAVIAEESSDITIYPLRSYLDGNEIRRAGGKPYKSPKHDAVSLIGAGLATDKNPKV